MPTPGRSPGRHLWPLLLRAADREVVHAATATEAGLEVNFAARQPDGSFEVFHLALDLRNAEDWWTVSVRERDGRQRLPLGCPERHINSDGSFCLGLSRVDSLLPLTLEDAQAWWSRLHGFLNLQLMAGRRGRWATGKAWPHGRAGHLEHELSTALQEVPVGVAEAATRGLVRLRHDRVDRVVKRRSPCPCGSRLQARRCHEAVLVRLLHLPPEIRIAEAEYVEAWPGRCCGTMQVCPIRARDGVREAPHAGRAAA